MVASTHECYIGGGKFSKLSISRHQPIHIVRMVVFWSYATASPTRVVAPLHGAEGVPTLNDRCALVYGLLHVPMDHILVTMRVVPVLIKLKQGPDGLSGLHWLRPGNHRDFPTATQFKYWFIRHFEIFVQYS